MPESQSLNQVLLSATPAQDRITTSGTQPQKNPNIPSTKNPTPTTYQRSTLFQIVVLILGILFLTLLVYLIDPRINTLSSYTVSSATVDPFNISSSRLTAAWNISIYIKNYHQRKEIYYDRVRSSIYYGSHFLSQVSIHPFYVQRSRHMTLQARLMNHSESLDVGAAESMVRDRLLRGAVDFRFELLTRAKYTVYNFGWYNFRISCENVTVGFPATDDVGPGVMLGPPRKCNLFVDEWPDTL
ncbi:uncharacterized protein LOC131239392 [Magnolia sinica]|uniref:uncharacterized protein LOC131239392 n=1 Tax=Magnolia sinica TaxID=86752 RepID=UPI0026584B34|nr:uncharacterized protein LOC131239392 [Magnolia sinica]XP_058093068.1 uncharacterized protein LOC131239392 [Magnolia sinica]XP_058093069.1 uncharacterized protein LOC131239392 [Magnolia sinica]